MKLQRFALAAAGLGLFAGSVAPIPAVAAAQAEPKPDSVAGQAAGRASGVSALAAACDIWIGSPNTARRVPSMIVDATKPPKLDPEGDSFVALPFYATRANSTWYYVGGKPPYFYGLFLQGSNLYRHVMYLEAAAPRPTARKIGGGWGSFRAIATTNYAVAAPRHHYLYALNTNGRLYRYAQSGAAFKALGSFPGFAGFKTMTPISENPRYDTLLMTTKQGALYTVRIPTTASAKPVVKLVRKSGWTAFESLAVYGCGSRGGNLVVGVDKDTKTGYLYAFSKANGTSTAITSYGKVPRAIDGVDTVVFTGHLEPLAGE